MSRDPSGVDLTPILSVRIQTERDVVAARQRARQISTLLGFGAQDQVRIATAVSEIARNAFQYAGGGQVEFSVDLRSRPQSLWIQVSDSGPGLPDLDAILSGRYDSPTGMGMGVAGTSRLMDQFHHTETPGGGATILFSKRIPSNSGPVEMADIGRIAGSLAQQPISSADQELQRQNQDLLQALDALRVREAELKKRQEDFARLNVELEETNRGVVALYAELEEKAIDLRRADEIKTRFLSHVSHEFRTPVNSVLALTRLLLDRLDGDLSPEQEKQVSYIRDAAQQLAEIVNDLLDLAKVDSGKTEIHATPTDVAQFLGSTRALMRPLVTRDTVVLVVEEPAPGLTVYTDQSKLGQIVRNLISNALKFTQQGEVRVAANLSKDGDNICFTVKDTGIGVAAQDQERIFQEFSQINNPIQNQVKGTGLGLPLSRRLATLLGGTLEVESAIDLGSTFTLSLPVGKLFQGVMAEEDDPSVPAPPATILIVDDDPVARYVLRQMLRGTRCRMVEVTGLEAAERARFERPALILLDLVMPDRSGFEILDDLKRDESTRNIPVVIHTSKTLSQGDIARLAGRHVGILPKGPEGRLPALLAIRALLDEPALFSSEPELTNKPNSGSGKHV